MDFHDDHDETVLAWGDAGAPVHHHLYMDEGVDGAFDQEAILPTDGHPTDPVPELLDDPFGTIPTSQLHTGSDSGIPTVESASPVATRTPGSPTGAEASSSRLTISSSASGAEGPISPLTAAGPGGKSTSMMADFATSPIPPPVATGECTNPDLVIVVDQPQRHGEGMDNYTSYLVTTTTTMREFARQTVSVRRRYGDFVWLAARLRHAHPTAILPPLPEKSRRAYLDRMQPAFVERRRAALQRFMNRCASHPGICTSQWLRLFLEAPRAELETRIQSSKIPKDDIYDVVLNALSKTENPDPRFVPHHEYLADLQQALSNLEKLYSRLQKKHLDLAADHYDFGSILTLMAEEERDAPRPAGADLAPGSSSSGHQDNTLSSFSAGAEPREPGTYSIGSFPPASGPVAAAVFRTMAAAEEAFSIVQKDFVEYVERNFIEQIHDYMLYCYTIRDVLKSREQRQIDMEELAEISQELADKYEELKNPDAPASTSSWLSSLSGESKETRATKIGEKLSQVQQEAQTASEIHSQFAQLALVELEQIGLQRSQDFTALLRNYVQAQVSLLRSGRSIYATALEKIKAYTSGDLPAE
ncbi:hypothetical protein, variant [Fonticula alba]|uniref:PX domain-containing protein n=1 Tax=Fonticula alba TaxID=691883 RepID=A0A058ZD43_FONAL|nr:hypothetical protein, variant [Fonticula alba]KCV71856.1 hypothetical protein, variant [Fonticula alba]|eukprot:XP_009493433.1 hypothetical protein, variant [Fonticula alba]